MLYIVNKSLNITKYNNMIMYHDSSWKVLETNKQLDIFELLKLFETPQSLAILNNYKELSEGEIKKIVGFLIDNHLIVEYKDKFTRNDIFFRRYGEGLSDEIKGKHVMIIGCGTVGATLALAIAKLGIRNICLVDNDKVTENSIESQVIFCREHIGEYKIDIIERRLCRENHDANILKIKKRIEDLNDFIDCYAKMNFDYVINCADEIDDDVLLNILKTLNLTKTHYIETGYIDQRNIIVFIAKYSEYINYLLNVFSRQKDIERISTNGGIIADSLLLSGMIVNIIVKDYLFELDNKLLVIDLSKFLIEDKFSGEIVEWDKFIKSIHYVYSQEEMDNIININPFHIKNIEEFLDMFNLIMFTNRIGITERVLNMETYNYLIDKFDLNKENEDLQIYNILNKDFNSQFKGIGQCMAAVNLSGNITLQESIYHHLEKNKSKLVESLYYKRRKMLYSEYDKHLVQDKIIEDIKNLDDREYNKICLNDLKVHSNGKVNKNIDFLKNEDFMNMNAVPYSEIIDFIEKLISFLPKEYSNIINKMLHSNNILIDISGNNGQTYYSPLKDVSLIYASYDGTYRGIFTILHELGHFVSNKLYDGMDFFRRNIIEREVFADAFVIYVLNKIPKNYSEELTKIKHNGINHYLKSLRYIIDTILFVKLIDNSITDGNVLKTIDYDEIFDQIVKKENLGINYVNSELFKNNYLANILIYSDDCININKLIILVSAILFSKCIYEDKKIFRIKI